MVNCKGALTRITNGCLTQRGLVSNSCFLENKVKQPDRSDEEKFEIVDERGLFAFDLMTDKLAYPSNYKYEQTDLPHLRPAVLLMKLLKANNCRAKNHDDQEHCV